MIRMPNRISVRPGDRGFMDPAIARDIVVLCDGEPLRGCRAADRKRGIAWCYVLDPRGRVVDDPDRPGRALEVVVRGKIEFRLITELATARPSERSDDDAGM